MKNRLLQLMRDNAGSLGAALRAEVNGDTADIYLYDVIDSWFGLSAAEFVKELAGISAKTINLHINSPGGDVFDARAMASAISAHPSRVVAHIEGVAASAATYVALAAAEVNMAEGAMFMVHNAWTLTMGDAEELRATADLLDKVDASIVADYMRKTKASQDQVRAWMEAETWFSAAEALAAGFVDAIAQPGSAQARAWNLSAYRNVPQQALPSTAGDWVAHEAALAALHRHNENRMQLYQRPS